MGPSIINGDVSRPNATTAFWPSLAQPKFEKWYQIALAIKDMKLRILRILVVNLLREACDRVKALIQLVFYEGMTDIDLLFFLALSACDLARFY
ncbi:hypothetical protein PanWU01x14_132170 [Parasponia andersonii]|uniref:Uncharacterized protein n=1 Tax=Parasponia andersonii TaxID=3476 RepID=A0A2P5CQH8_PARAD|nr:hypothetical protein PanWU01x14_132170 [Parasponia andersonii]